MEGIISIKKDSNTGELTFWNPTMNLRWFESNNPFESKHTLQQEWTSSIGTREWRKVEVVLDKPYTILCENNNNKQS